MKTEIIDYHGFTVEEALTDFERRLWSIDTVEGKRFEVITGQGKIRTAITKFLNKNLVSWYYAIGNQGCIIVNISEYKTK